MKQLLTGVAAGLAILSGASSADAVTTFHGPSAYVSAADAPELKRLLPTKAR